MAQDPGGVSSSEPTHEDIQRAAKQAGINRPVMKARVVGDRIELHLLGGGAVSVNPTWHTAHAPTPTTGQGSSSVIPTPTSDFLPDMPLRQLRAIARHLEVSGYSRMKKEELVNTLIAGFTDEQLAEAVRR